MYEALLSRYPSMSEHYILFRIPLIRAWALSCAALVREGKKLPGPSYADMDLSDAIDRATDALNTR